MKPFFSLFAKDDFSLIAVVLLMPLLGAFVNGVFGRRLGKQAVRLMALAAIGISFAAAVLTFAALNDASDVAAKAHGGEPEHVKLAWLAWEWMRASGPFGSKISIDLKFSVDALSGVMMLVVTGVGFLIHVYASEYMIADKGYWRFFCYLNLFVFSMLVLILGDNLPVLFVGWEGVGLCSYLLIGFWYKKLPNAAAGKKAFIANRIGDFGLIVAMFLLVVYCGSLDWDGLHHHATDLVANSDRPGPVNLWPIGGGRFDDYFVFGLRIPLSKLQPHSATGSPTSWTITAATAVALMLFLGATGKSAQIPLYVWLPDAMAGPTPVSALIHAATMVTAGIYLICRLSFIFVLSPAAMLVVAFTGAATALLAATIAVVQNDIKRVLAYSTVSQLGFMVLGVGVGAFTAGFFHVFTHAFFKACLFLGAGSVIHAMHARIHDEDRSQDMRNMGGLKKYMPITFWTFAASTLCIIGFPGTSGFFSKDEILARVLMETPAGIKTGIPAWQWPSWAPWVLWGLGITAATLTAFYMARSVFLTFYGEFRGWTIGRPSQLIATDDHGHAEEESEEEDDGHHHHEDLSTPGYPPHESPRAMTIPLIVLAAAAIVAGVFNPGAIKLVAHSFSFLPLEHWLDPVFKDAAAGIAMADEHTAHSRELISTAGAFSAFAIGSAVAYWVYIKEKGKPARDTMLKFPTLYRLVLDKWRVDELYDKTAVAGVDALADTAASVDQGVVDFILARLTSLIVAAAGTVLRVVQNGVVHVYAAVMVVGMAAMGWFFVEPHAEFTVAEQNGDYTLTAGNGPGYAFKWYSDATKEADTKDFAVNDNIKVHVADGKTQTVKLEVKNAFGRTASKAFTITRPQQPGSAGAKEKGQ
jgi:NADH-quinone oxidoreductase subunit L